MSIRAQFINFMLRRTIKVQFETLGEDPSALREKMAAGGLAPALPEDVVVEKVSAGDVPAEWVSYGECEADKPVLYLHGGGYVVGSPDSHRDLAWRISGESNRRVLVLDYRLAPENPFPAAVEDATAAYRWLLAEGYDANNIVIGGDSAGGGLAVALMLNLKNIGVPLPAGAFLLSPWVDLAVSGDSVARNAKVDAMLSPKALHTMAAHYVGDLDTKAPLASPLYGDLTGLPPILVQVGSTEVLLSDSERLVNKIVEAGGNAQLDVWPKMPHVFPLLAARIPEGKQAVTQLGEFIKARHA